MCLGVRVFGAVAGLMVVAQSEAVIASEAKQSHATRVAEIASACTQVSLPDLRMNCCRARVNPRSVHALQ